MRRGGEMVDAAGNQNPPDSSPSRFESEPRHPYRPWTTRELTLLDQHYRRGGLEAARAALPHRTPGAIYQKAVLKLGIRLGRRNVRGAWWTQSDQIDALLREVFERPAGRQALTALAKRVDRPRWWLSRRALALGLKAPRFADPDWSEAEIELLAQTAHLSPRVAQRKFAAAGFRRSEAAVIVKRKRERCRPSDNGYYTATQLAELLGIGCAKTITRAIRAGELRASPRGTARTSQQGGDHWWIREQDLRAYIVAHPMRIDLRKVPVASTSWFIQLLTG